MTIPESFNPGDRVMVLGKIAGTVRGRDEFDPTLYRVAKDSRLDGVTTIISSHHDLERIPTPHAGQRVQLDEGNWGTVMEQSDRNPNQWHVLADNDELLEIGDSLMGMKTDEVDESAAEAPSRAEAMSSSVEGATSGDPGSTGTTVEPETEAAEPDAYGVDPLSGEVEGAEDPAILELLRRNHILQQQVALLLATVEHAALSTPVDETFRYLDGTPRTTRRVHTKITKNTKGYQHEISVEVTSDDPTWSVTDDVRDTLDLSDKDARLHIRTAEYRDEHGLPGEEFDPQPF